MNDSKKIIGNNIKLIGFYAESDRYFELSNFGGKGNYVNKYGDPGEYSEITYQASKLSYIRDNSIGRQLKQQYFNEVETPEQAFTFMRKLLPQLNYRSVNDVIKENNWDTPDKSGVSNKDLEMAYCLISKFDPGNAAMRYIQLLNIVSDSNIVLVEKSPNDSYWGYAMDAQQNLGKNRLGLLLTALAQVLNQTLAVRLSESDKMKMVLDQYQLFINQFAGFDFQVSRKI